MKYSTHPHFLIFFIVRRNLLLAAPIDWSIHFSATPGFVLSSWYISFVPPKIYPSWFPSMPSIDWEAGELFFTEGETNGS
jgi:hypothetical protein